MRYTKLAYLFPLAFVLVIAACTTESVQPDNPFDSIERPEDTNAPPPDSATIVGLHKYIFEQKCATPACHDGSFEPDFRTPASSYTSLVYHGTIKNTPDNAFDYRVTPNDVPGSWLYERVTTGDANLGRMPLYDDPLNNSELKAIRDWINAGAPDMFGQTSNQPNTQPRVKAVIAFIDTSFGGFPVEYRVDTLRDETNPYSPFGVVSDRWLNLWFALEDDNASPNELQNMQLKVSSDPNDFGTAPTYDMVYESDPKTLNTYMGEPGDYRFYHRVSFHTGNLTVNQIYYYRIFGQDPALSDPLEYPDDNASLNAKFFNAFTPVN